MNCDPNVLMGASACYKCIPGNLFKAVQVYLLCQWYSKPVPVPLCDADACDLVSPDEVNSISVLNFSGASVGLTATTLSSTYIADNANLTLICIPNCTSLVMFIPGSFYIARNPKLTDLELPNLVDATLSNFQIDTDNALVQLNLPSVTGMGDVGIHDCAALTTISAPVLTNVIGYVSIRRLNLLTSLDLHSLVTVHESCDFNLNPSLSSLNLPSLTSIPGAVYVPTFNCAGCTNLSSVDIHNYLPANTTQLTFSGCALPVGQVDAILARCVASAAFVSGSVDLSGGTNAAPSSIGLGSDTATLIARGVTVIHN